MTVFTLKEIRAYIAALEATDNGSKHELARTLKISVLPALLRRKRAARRRTRA